MTPIEYAFNAGRFARMLEDYNREAEALLNEMGFSQSKVKEAVSGNEHRDLRDVREIGCPVIRPQIETTLRHD